MRISQQTNMQTIEYGDKSYYGGYAYGPRIHVCQVEAFMGGPETGNYTVIRRVIGLL